MNRDQVWQELKNDDTTVYGEPILNQFVRMTEHLKERHWDELTPGQKRLANPKVRLDFAPSIEEAERAIKDGAEDTWPTYRYAAKKGNMELLKWLAKRDESPNWQGVMNGAAEGGDMEMLDWAKERSRGWPIDFLRPITMAASSGNIHVLDALEHHMPEDEEIRIEWLTQVLFNAAVNGQLEAVEWAAERGAQKRMWTLKNAAENGHTEVVKWLYDRLDSKPAELDVNDCIGRAKQAGRTEVADFLRNKLKERFQNKLRGRK